MLGWVAGEMAITDPVAKAGSMRRRHCCTTPHWPPFRSFLHYVAAVAGAIGVVLVGKWLASRAASAARKSPPVAVAHAPGRLQRVLLAVDGSERAARAVRHLIALGQNLRKPHSPGSASAERAAPGVG